MNINIAIIQITRPHSGVNWLYFFDTYFPGYCSRHNYTQKDEAIINLILADVRTALERDSVRYTLITKKIRSELGIQRITYDNCTKLIARALWSSKLKDKLEPGALCKYCEENGYERR